MKRTAISIILACQCLIAFPLDYATALRIASDYVDLPDNNEVRTRSNSVNIEDKDYYIFNDRVKGNGFVIISGKDDVNPVLGYSDKGFVNESNLPASLQYFLTHTWTSGQSVDKCTRSSVPAQPIVGPLVKTQWYQLEPYNAKTPGPAFFTGCVATAMAQVMNYHKWPERGHGAVSYTSYSPSDGNKADPVGELSYDLSQSVYDWNNMLPTYQDGKWNDAQVDAMSTLMRDCGYAAHMLYRTSESTSYDHDAATALVQNFGYDVNAYPHYGDYDTKTWLGIMKAELDNGFPVIMTGQAKMYGGGGHCFIADGYDSNDFIHINWGWNGDADGYYSLGMFTPVHGGKNHNYSYMQNMITAHPRRPYSEATYNPWLSMLYDLQNVDFEHSGLTIENENAILDSETPARIRIDGLVYVSSYPLKGTFNLVLTDAAGKELKTVAQRDFDYKGLNSEDDGQLIGVSSISVDAAAFYGVADGNYRLVPMSQTGGMAPQPVQGYGYKNYVNVNISDGKVRLSNVPKPDTKLSVTRMMSVEPEIPWFSAINGEIELANSGSFIEGGDLEVYADPQDGTDPVLVFRENVALYENQSKSVPVHIEILPEMDFGKLHTDAEYSLVFTITGADKKPVALENKFEAPRFKVVYNPEYLPHTTITSIKITDTSGNEVTKDDSGTPELDVNQEYRMNYSLKTVCKGISPKSVYAKIQIESDPFSTTGKEISLYEDSKFDTELLLKYYLLEPGEDYILFSHSDYFDRSKFIIPQPENLARFKVKFVDPSSGIDNISTESQVKETARYNLQGIKVNSDTKGFVIIHYNDGSTRKIFVK